MKVEKNIPVPSKYPFHLMEVGDSFAIPETTKRVTAHVAASRYGRANNMQFIVRIMPDRSYRCWRVK